MLQEWKAMEKPEEEEIRVRLAAAKEKLAKQQLLIKEQKIPVLVLMEGWGTAGKGSVIGQVIQNIDPRFFKVESGQTDIAKTIGFESNEEYNEIMFLREITPTINALNEMADIVRLYSKKPKTAEQRLANLLSEVLYEDSESV